MNKKYSVVQCSIIKFLMRKNIKSIGVYKRLKKQVTDDCFSQIQMF